MNKFNTFRRIIMKIGVMSDTHGSLPYFEKALELNPNDKNTLTTLKELYFRLRTKNKVYQEKYDKTMEALNSL